MWGLLANWQKQLERQWLARLRTGDTELNELDFPVAEALRWLSWHEAWLAALTRLDGRCLEERSEPGYVALPGEVAKATREPLLHRAREVWQRVGTDLLGERLAADVLVAAGAISRHTAACRVRPRSQVAAANQWRTFSDAIEKLQDSGKLSEGLVTSMKWLLWNAAWTAAIAVSDHDADGDIQDIDWDLTLDKAVGEEGDEGDRPDVEQTVFGEDYPGSESDAVGSLGNWLQHHRELFFSGSEFPWRGICIQNLDCAEQHVGQAIGAGFNATRLVVPEPRAGSLEEAVDELRPVLAACGDLGATAVLDLTGWPLPLDLEADPGGCGGLEERIFELASRTAEHRCIRAVALPLVEVHQIGLLIQALRSGGFSPQRCAAIVNVDDEAVNESDEYGGSLKQALCQGESGILVQDGNVLFEVARPSPFDQGLSEAQAVLDWASSSGGIESRLCFACVRFSLALPDAGATITKGDLAHGEFCARLVAAADGASYGFFACVEESDSLGWLLGRGWTWPDPTADIILQVDYSNHKATLIMLGGFTCTGSSYMTCAEYFYSKGLPAEGIEDEDKDAAIYRYYPGLKVVLPTPPRLAITAHGGHENHSWHDYITDHEGEKEDKLGLASLESSVARVQALMQREAQLVGARSVFLGGSSQGAGVALHAALTYPEAIGGVLAYQGQLLTLTPVPADWARRRVPVRVGCGLADTTMPWEKWVKATFDRLRGSGMDYREETFEGVDHSDDVQEGICVRDFLHEMLRTWHL